MENVGEIPVAEWRERSAGIGFLDAEKKVFFVCWWIDDDVGARRAGRGD
jgi:hypothetical protein